MCFKETDSGMLQDMLQEMWSDMDERGIKSECFFDPDNSTYFVKVSYNGEERYDTFRANTEPNIGMDGQDVDIAYRLIKGLTKEIESVFGIVN